MNALDSIGYKVYVDRELASLQRFVNDRQYSKIFLLTDRNTTEHCLPKIQTILDNFRGYDLIEIDPGEENKNIDFCIGIWKMLIDFGADRNSLMINLGGGVITDIGGFSASTFKRGIDFVHIPTTLLSQVDASVGGKTGIDMDGVKNIIGTFTQPQAVFVNPAFLSTLNQQQKVSGFAEMVKHGLIYDTAYFDKLKLTDPLVMDDMLIYQSISIKNQVVKEDPTEKGLRKILNFGHTIGHAIESYSLAFDSFPLLHGQAIAIGMICESFLSHRYNGLAKSELDIIVDYLLRVFPSYSFGEGIYQELINYMVNDKKNKNGEIGFALLKTIGSCTPNHYLSEEAIISSLDYYRSILAANHLVQQLK